MGPAEAVRAGASYIVVGRPIIAATDPTESAAAAIAEEIWARPREGPDVRPDDYFAVTMKCPRRFCAQHAFGLLGADRRSSPLLSTIKRSAAMPRLTR